MNHITPIQEPPSGIKPLLTKSLPQRELDEHRANVCVIMEMMVRKYDKFGWDQMNTGMRQMIREDWLAALADYPVDEVRAACRAHTQALPNKVPNEGHIKAQIMLVRKATLAALPKPVEPERPAKAKATAEERARIMAEAGFRPASVEHIGAGLRPTPPQGEAQTRANINAAKDEVEGIAL